MKLLANEAFRRFIKDAEEIKHMEVGDEPKSITSTSSIMKMLKISDDMTGIKTNFKQGTFTFCCDEGRDNIFIVKKRKVAKRVLNGVTL